MATRYQARHDECGFVGKPTSKALAQRALRVHSCERHMRRLAAPIVGAPCEVAIDLPGEVAAPAVGDWIVTRAGSRYLVRTCRAVRPRVPQPFVRYQLRCLRLAKHCPIPDDVRAIELRWHRR